MYHVSRVEIGEIGGGEEIIPAGLKFLRGTRN
jgi:hypothetical protein